MTDQDEVHIDREVHYVDSPRRSRGFIAGILVAVVAIAAAIGVYLAVSDDDADGQIDVPSVDVDVDNNE